MEKQVSDEDKMIRKLTMHRNLVSWVLALLKKNDIPSERTFGNDTRGDIQYFDEDDSGKVKDIVSRLNSGDGNL